MKKDIAIRDWQAEYLADELLLRNMIEPYTAPKTKKGAPKNFAFIDSQNLNLAIREQGWQLDFARFRRYLADKYNVAQAYLFIGFIEGNEKLYEHLRQAGYYLVFKPTLLIKGKMIKGNVDAELVLHCMIQLENFEEAVLVTGDGDFFCLVEYLLEKGKLCKLLVPNERKYSGLLKSFGREKMEFLNPLRVKLGDKFNKRSNKNGRQPHKDSPLQISSRRD